jgi:hypothetical protein
MCLACKGLLSDKKLTAGRDISGVYLELLACYMDGGVIEIGNKSDHDYAAGYTGTRAIRTWLERMQLLEQLGFIKSKHVGNQRYKLVLLVDSSLWPICGNKERSTARGGKPTRFDS